MLKTEYSENLCWNFICRIGPRPNQGIKIKVPKVDGFATMSTNTNTTQRATTTAATTSVPRTTSTPTSAILVRITASSTTSEYPEKFHQTDNITCLGLVASGQAASALEASDLDSWDRNCKTFCPNC